VELCLAVYCLYL